MFNKYDKLKTKPKTEIETEIDGDQSQSWMKWEWNQCSFPSSYLNFIFYSFYCEKHKFTNMLCGL